MVRNLPLLCFVLAACLVTGSAVAAPGDPELDAAMDAQDTDLICARMHALAKADPVLAVQAIPAAYKKMERASEHDFYHGDRYRIFKQAIQALAKVKGKKALRVIRKIFEASSSWEERFLILHASLQHPELDAVNYALTGVKGKSSQLVASSARVLGNCQDTVALDPLVAAMKKWEKREVIEEVHKGRRVLMKSAPGTAWVACRDALQRLTGKGLHSASEFKNYIKAHRGKIDPKRVAETLSDDAPEKRTGVGLFGLDLTGYRLIFILDISGSMEASDPLTPEQLEKLRRRTGVPGDAAEKELMNERKRIRRAKAELVKVINALPEDRRFNVITFSTEVTSWKEAMVTADGTAKKSAVEFVTGLKATGITVTDDALARAFEDPLVDTVYLITDGAPTHVGSQGRQGLPPDSRRLMGRILAEMKAANYLRQVRIFTLGFQGAYIQFLKQLSEENFGLYHTIK
ncbi:MAG: hypothetical protein AAF581_23020 [Planctomycetota bacterium]